MSIQPVTTGNRESHRPQMLIEANLRAGTSGVSSVASSIASASTADPQTTASGGVCAWVYSIIEGLRNCLAKLPLIGRFFETGSTSISSVTSSSVNPHAAADALLINVIKSIFKQTPAASSGITVVAPLIPGADLVNLARDQFNGIQTPAAKWEAFGIVLNADNSTVPIIKEFYNALTPEMKEEFKGEMYRQNGNSRFNGVDHGIGFGEFMVHHQIRSPLAKSAVAHLQGAPTP